MLKDATYKEKYRALKNWMPAIVDVVKKDLKNEHLKADFVFAKRYFAGKNLNKLTNEELVEGYSSAIQQEEKGEEIAEFITNRWLIKNSELYGFFEEELSKINPDFSAIKEIEKSRSQEIVDGAVKQFGAPRTFLFSVLNSVAFSDDAFKKLGQQAEQEAKKAEQDAVQQADLKNIEQIKRACEEQIARITDKFEKKLEGLQKKYLQDTEGLKKQISALQRKLS